MKSLLISFLLLSTFSNTAFASSENAINTAKLSVVTYAMYRILGLGGNELSEKQICGLAGQGFTGVSVMKAFGLSDQDMANEFSNLIPYGLTYDLLSETLLTDMDDCTK